MKAVIKRLKSKTYWAAIIGAALTVVEANSGLLSKFVDEAYRAYVVMMWPVLMIGLRELTTAPLAEK